MTTEPQDLTKLSADELKRLLWQERIKHGQEVERLTAQVAEAREIMLAALKDSDRAERLGNNDAYWGQADRARVWLETNQEPKKDGDHD